MSRHLSVTICRKCASEEEQPVQRAWGQRGVAFGPWQGAPMAMSDVLRPLPEVSVFPGGSPTSQQLRARRKSIALVGPTGSATDHHQQRKNLSLQGIQSLKRTQLTNLTAQGRAQRICHQLLLGPRALYPPPSPFHLRPLHFQNHQPLPHLRPCPSLPSSFL